MQDFFRLVFVVFDANHTRSLHRLDGTSQSFALRRHRFEKYAVVYRSVFGNDIIQRQSVSHPTQNRISIRDSKVGDAVAAAARAVADDADAEDVFDFVAVAIEGRASHRNSFV